MLLLVCLFVDCLSEDVLHSETSCFHESTEVESAEHAGLSPRCPAAKHFPITCWWERLQWGIGSSVWLECKIFSAIQDLMSLWIHRSAKTPQISQSNFSFVRADWSRFTTVRGQHLCFCHLLQTHDYNVEAPLLLWVCKHVEEVL